MANEWIGQPLANALYILPPFPFEAHTSLLLHTFWGSYDLPMLEDQIRTMYATMTRVGRLTRTKFDEPPRWDRRTVHFRLGDGLELRGSPVDHATHPLHMLLPDTGEDIWTLRRPDREGEQYDLMLTFGGSSASSPEAPGYTELCHWALTAKDLCEDLADAAKVLNRAADIGKCNLATVLRSVYPAARAAFPELTYGKRVLGPLQLRRLIHPDDQDMLRYTLDQAAGGKLVPDKERRLTAMNLAYNS